MEKAQCRKMVDISMPKKRTVQERRFSKLLKEESCLQNRDENLFRRPWRTIKAKTRFVHRISVSQRTLEITKNKLFKISY